MAETKRAALLGRSLATGGVFTLAGFLIGLAAINASGGDLRPDRTSDLDELVSTQSQRVTQLRERAEQLRAENDELVASRPQAPPAPDPDYLAAVGLRAVTGPAVRVTLTDAPINFSPEGVDEDLLVVHEQDIQQVVNALWQAGAEAMTIQGERVIATTAVKCVGNTVVLHGVPHAPPYVIEAIGDPDDLERGLAASEGVQIYREYASTYRLGYEQERVSRSQMPAYEGTLGGKAEAHR